MNQAALHQLFTSKYPSHKASNLDKLFEIRVATNLTLIKDLFFTLYPKENSLASFEKLLEKLPKLFKSRPNQLKIQDLRRLNQGDWYKSTQLNGMQLYVDHFSKDLKGLEEKIGYFEKLGVTFLHLMPITPRPKGANDGGYAVNSYHEVDPRYGTEDDLLELTHEMRKKNMFLMLDFVANHTSNEYIWAQKAKEGEVQFQDYYYTFPDRQIPDIFERSLPEVFPMTSPGNFTYDPQMQKWVMTVFNQYQWDLNYSNPEVFIEMLGNLIKLVNLGVDVVRLDALAFMWKKMGTQSQNLPEAHALISLFRLCLQTIAPGVVFLAEAIVAPNEIINYFGSGNMKGNECEIAYNATLMALLWDAIATKKTILLYKNLYQLPKKPIEATWINYIRCHDDIGLGFEDSHIKEIGWDAKKHRKFLLDYYSGSIDWSPAKGGIFMYNPKTDDGRITGSSASLLGLEKALFLKNRAKTKEAISKIIMMHGIILSFGGIPLIYAGDEIGTLNDYSYLSDLNKKEDGRWVNRPQQEWKVVAELDQKKSYHSEIFFALKHLIHLRKKNPILADHNNFLLCDSENPHIFMYERTSEKKEGILIVCNFDESPQTIKKFELGKYTEKNKPKDLISGRPLKFDQHTLKLKPYELLWLKKA